MLRHINIVTTPEALAEVVAAYSRVDAFAFDVETMGEGTIRLDTRRNDVVWIALATYGRADVIPMGHPNGEYVRTEYPLLSAGIRRRAKGLAPLPSDFSKDDKKAVKIFTEAPPQLRPAEVFAALKPLFLSPETTKVAHNLKFDVESCTKYLGQQPVGPYADTMIAAWLLDSRLTGHLNLAETLGREMGYHMVKGVGAMIEEHAFSKVAKYGYLDVRYTWYLYCILKKKVAEANQRKLYTLEMDVMEAVVAMELAGADIDIPDLKALKARLEGEIEDAKADIFRQAGRAFNINSNQDKQKLLFTRKVEGGRGLKVKKRTTSGAPSVAADALELYRGKDSLIDALLTYADLNKLMSTYVIPYLGGDIVRTVNGKERVVHKESMLVNGRLHAQFVQNGAETGRFASRNPNLQNVPNPRTEHGRAIRNLFIAPPDWALIVADYSQIEPRIIASETKDPILCKAYADEIDVYMAIAGPLGLDRSAGKIGVLAMSYGVGPDKVEASLGLPAGKGKELLADFEKQFATVYKYKKRLCAQARLRRPVPYVSTILGRRRYLPDLRSDVFGLRARAERQAFNTFIQGSAADLMKIAIVRAYRMLPPEASLILTIHDELVTRAPKHMADEVAEIIREAMEGIHIIDVPLIADVKVVDKWGAAK